MEFKIAVQLWIGVVFLVASGLGCVSGLRTWITGRYRSEIYGPDVTKPLWVLVRSFYQAFWAFGAVASFGCAIWLVRYILTH